LGVKWRQMKESAIIELILNTERSLRHLSLLLTHVHPLITNKVVIV
jgi:hypothetical protein